MIALNIFLLLQFQAATIFREAALVNQSLPGNVLLLFFVLITIISISVTPRLPVFCFLLSDDSLVCADSHFCYKFH